jgi:hypothetical protein
MTSHLKSARLAGLLYLLMIPTIGLAYGGGQLLVAPDVAQTIVRIQTHRELVELGIVASAFGFVDFLVLALVLYRLFSPVSRGAASLMLAFVAASVPVSLAAVGRWMDILALLDGAQGLPALGTADVQVQVALALESYRNLLLISSIFWGLWLVPLGWLIVQSRYIPRVLGLLLILGGPSYVLSFVGGVIDPGYANTLFAQVVGFASGVPGMMGELGTCLWLLIMGAREPKAA